MRDAPEAPIWPPWPEASPPIRPAIPAGPWRTRSGYPYRAARSTSVSLMA